MNQRELCEQLADELDDCGHDITTLDLLDAIASRGLELIQPPEAAASDAYQQAIRDATPPEAV